MLDSTENKVFSSLIYVFCVVVHDDTFMKTLCVVFKWSDTENVLLFHQPIYLTF